MSLSTAAKSTAAKGPPMRRLAVPHFVDPDVLHLILMPTERCNFRCVYCYESFTRGAMSRPTIDGLRRLLSRRAPRLRSLSLEWFGGEPLLELATIVELQEHAGALAASHPGMRLRCSMTTNAYLLTPEVLERLVALGVREYQISLDGPPSSHDARRRRADGAGTFARVWSHLLAARDRRLDVLIRLRIHVDRENRDLLPAFLEDLARELAGDDRFEIYLRHVGRFGGPNDAALPILEGAELGVVEALRRRAGELGLRRRPPDRSPGCYAAAANSFVIRSTGEIGKCTVALEHPANQIGQLRPDGTAVLDQGRLNGWLRGLSNGDPAALSCPMRGLADPPSPRSRELPVLSA